ncbi:MAG: hypothetical protein LBJ12_03970 [Oscillospiraceae bacterium]|jgi:hypothetical protein|nr:hypothetical protein [Oscillospiraceae bacterium]
MACFLVPATEAIVTTIVRKVASSKEKQSRVSKAGSAPHNAEQNVKIPFARKLKWLNNLLWGGSALLAFEHVWHGEVTPSPPFLTATGNPEDMTAMLHEMVTTGVSMALIVTIVWLGIVLVTNTMEKKERKERLAAN